MIFNNQINFNKQIKLYQILCFSINYFIVKRRFNFISCLHTKRKVENCTQPFALSTESNFLEMGVGYSKPWHEVLVILKIIVIVYTATVESGVNYTQHFTSSGETLEHDIKIVEFLWGRRRSLRNFEYNFLLFERWNVLISIILN